MIEKNHNGTCNRTRFVTGTVSCIVSKLKTTSFINKTCNRTMFVTGTVSCIVSKLKTTTVLSTKHVIEQGL